ncbi:excinuclease ABC subunit UvrC [Acetobacterium sp. K1/6]|uniref:excinuclease ABC subunit UvrC n=1 Tax=Acetobacterium sp. K1/6 TaxID=3055467 RepID=UPI002ACACACE|nr:excinuclease ABC subunit UvrC [Acetobacterium sp. K1/6]MDZ5724856.1 excinuclease ABC subunit UvrC [Acetobacterium sp. K1/6]
MYDKEKLKDLPQNPGVYIMRNKNSEIIYVGKAINLRNRVRQYFHSASQLTAKTVVLVSHIETIETIVTDSEMEALILECNLIKTHHPRYNILLKDDKSYPWIRLTVQEEYPRLLMTREYKKDGAKYFGPFTSSYAVKNTIEAILKIYPLKTCNRQVAYGKKTGRPCLNYHIGQCQAPCQGNVSKEKYAKDIASVLDILNGRHPDLLKNINDKMTVAAMNQNYEEAAKYRDQISGIAHIVEKQKISSSAKQDQDFIGFAKSDGLGCVQVFHVREGKLMGRDHFFLEEVEGVSSREVQESFVKQYYASCGFIPREIILKEPLEDKKVIEEWLGDLAGKKIEVHAPKRGQKIKMLEMVTDNADLALKQKLLEKREKEIRSKSRLDGLQDLLGLAQRPVRIEAYDISNISGTNNVGGMVVFDEGKLNRKACRRFKIKSVEGQNDYASMQEMIFRRMERAMKAPEGNNFLPLPEVMMIDGGVGHVNAAQSIVSLYPTVAIEVCGLVKDDHHRLRGIFHQGTEYPIKKATPLGVFLSEISEEVHRYTLGYHQILRKKEMLVSQLEEIPGVGKKRREALMAYFGQVDKIKKATIEELQSVPGMQIKTAQAVFEHFRNKS